MDNEPDLLAYLLTKYEVTLRELNPDDLPAIEKTVRRAGNFVLWARKYLQDHRPSGLYHVPDNYGLMLPGDDGMDRIVVAPQSESVTNYDPFNNVDTSGTLRISSPGAQKDEMQAAALQVGSQPTQPKATPAASLAKSILEQGE